MSLLYSNMINTKIKQNFTDIFSIIDRINLDLQAIRHSLQSMENAQPNLNEAVAYSFFDLESEIHNYRKSTIALEMFFEQFIENSVNKCHIESSLHSIDPVDLLIKFSQETTMITYDISAESIDCHIVGICESQQISDEQEIDIAEVWGNCRPLAAAVFHLIDELSQLDHQGVTIDIELKNRHFISKLAGKPSPLVSIKKLLESGLN